MARPKFSSSATARNHRTRRSTPFARLISNGRLRLPTERKPVVASSLVAAHPRVIEARQDVRADDLTGTRKAATVRSSADRPRLSGSATCHTKFAWPHLIRRGGGVIINIASEAGMIAGAVPPMVAHTAANAGVIGMTRQRAMEGARHGIRAVAISPGPVLTPASDRDLGDDQAARDAIASKTLRKRFAQPEEIVELAAFLASDRAAYITGANYRRIDRLVALPGAQGMSAPPTNDRSRSWLSAPIWRSTVPRAFSDPARCGPPRRPASWTCCVPAPTRGTRRRVWP
ncbi:SDR family oxidoreductase [Streptomyces sp. NPDC002205]|uniref:SDR family NAD(P)-dependent oxidoreductase n=1 Tax=Streptomyces sp. NPDC002205 TaxID=3154411 RepID=UPI003332BE6F